MASDTALLHSELSFTIPLLLEFPKCYWIWNYRSFLLNLAIARLPVQTARQIWTSELALTSKMLTKDRRNFHAWGYRRRIVHTLESAELEGTSMAESEFEYTTKMINMDLSNFSAWHSRALLVPRILDERGADDDARTRLLEQELALVREGLNVGPEDQSLWYYHQFLMSHLTDWVGRPTMTPHLTIEERISYVEREIEEIRELLEDYEDVKLIYEALLEYCLALEGLRVEWGEFDGSGGSKEDMKGWLNKMRELDPLRNGRWNDVEQALEPAR
jgi:geranylgeranyl transferase type-2 subunit alpha